LVKIPVTQTSSIAHLASDPLRNFKFQVTIRPNSGAAINLGFMSVSGLNITVDVIAYRVGSYNTTTQKMPGQADFSPITLSRGLAVGTAQNWAWMTELFTVMQGTGPNNGTQDFRSTIDVQVLSHPVTASSANIPAWFRIYNAWPTALAYSDLDAGANQLLIEQMTLAHEGFDFDLASALGQDAATPPAFTPATN
jgi:phage tail-like protein